MDTTGLMLVLVHAFSSIALLACRAPAQDSVRDGVTLEWIIDNVEANENLYNNIEFDISSNYRDNIVQKDTIIRSIENQETLEKCVYKSDKMYYSYHADLRYAGSSDVETIDRVVAYDGKSSLVYDQGIMHNSDQPTDATKLPRPHSMLIPDYLAMPLSLMLKGDTETRLLPGYENVRLVVSLKGVEQIGDAECYMIEIINYQNGKSPQSNGYKRTYWLDPTKNFLPVRLAGSDVGNKREITEEFGEVLAFTEVGPGLFMPARLLYRTTEVGRENDRRVPHIEIEETITNAVLDPDRPDEFFRNIEDKDIYHKYIIKDNEIVEHAFVGTPRVGDFNPAKIALWLLVPLVTLVAAIVISRRYLGKNGERDKSTNL